MNEAFTIGNSNSIYTFSPKISLCRQAPYTGFTVNTRSAGDAAWLTPEEQTAHARWVKRHEFNVAGHLITFFLQNFRKKIDFLHG